MIDVLTRLFSSSVLIYLLSSAAALLSVRWIYFKILKIAKEKKLVDNPDARKLQKTPVPVLGGIAVFFGVLVGMLTGTSVMALPELLNHTAVNDPTTFLMPILSAMVVMLYVGAMDDIIGIRPSVRFLIEVLVVCALILSYGGCVDTFRGMWGIHELSWWVAVPMTVFAGVGIINAINMIDGVNGLSSGLCMTCSVLFGTAFAKVGDTANAVLAFSMTAALLPFFIHNVFGRKSRMFIGDAGTMVMGILMTWFTISTLRADSPVPYYSAAPRVNMIALCLAILAVPVFDTLRVMTMRVVNGRSPFSPDKTHLHHVFIIIGVSHSITTLAEILIDLAIVGIWSLSVKLGASLDWQLYIVVIAAVVLVWGVYGFLRYHANTHTNFLHKATRFSVKTHMGHTSWWIRLTEMLDAPEDWEEEDEDHKAHMANRYGHMRPVEIEELNKKAIYDYIKSHAEVLVSDIRIRSGAEDEWIEPVLEQGIEAGEIVVNKTDASGNPEIVSIRQ